MLRRNFAGVEEFRSYGHAVGSRLAEGMISTIGSLLFMAGVLSAFFAGYAVYLRRY